MPSNNRKFWAIIAAVVIVVIGFGSGVFPNPFAQQVGQSSCYADAVSCTNLGITDGNGVSATLLLPVYASGTRTPYVVNIQCQIVTPPSGSAACVIPPNFTVKFSSTTDEAIFLQTISKLALLYQSFYVCC